MSSMHPRDHPKRNDKTRGLGYDPLIEHVPGFDARKDDWVRKGKNSNTWIVLGRDRVGQVDIGYGDHSFAGAIDLVAGRMAPYPHTHVGSTAAKVDPFFKEVFDPRMEDDDLEGSGWVMDAARVYIAQMTNVDLSFGIAQGLDPAPAKDARVGSAVAVKADKVRLIGREGIKLVTTNLKEVKVQSKGGAMQFIHGIDLIAGNGKDGSGEPIPQEKLVKGAKLTQALKNLSGLVDNLNGIVDSILTSQMVFNSFLMTHFHLEAPLVVNTPSPTLSPAGIVTMIDHLARGKIGLLLHKLNLGIWEINHLTPGTQGYICSQFNTTN